MSGGLDLRIATVRARNLIPAGCSSTRAVSLCLLCGCEDSERAMLTLAELPMAVPGEACLTPFFLSQHLASSPSRYLTLCSRPVDTPAALSTRSSALNATPTSIYFFFLLNLSPLCALARCSDAVYPFFKILTRASLLLYRPRGNTSFA